MRGERGLRKQGSQQRHCMEWALPLESTNQGQRPSPCKLSHFSHFQFSSHLSAFVCARVEAILNWHLYETFLNSPWMVIGREGKFF